MNLALFQPDMASNAAAAIRLACCLGVPIDIIEPCGFIWQEKRLRRVGMDYLDHVSLHRWPSWEHFDENRRQAGRRLVLLTTKTATAYSGFEYRTGDVLLGGRESAGVPQEIHEMADARVGVPMAVGARSLNLVTALAMVLGEALRQTQGFPAASGKGDETSFA